MSSSHCSPEGRSASHSREGDKEHHREGEEMPHSVDGFHARDVTLAP